MDDALSGAWGRSSRGFWTKRKRAATSLLAILALLAGVAVAFKLFERPVPNNVVRDAANFSFVVEVFSEPPGGGTPNWQVAGPPPDLPIFGGAEAGSDQFPGDTREKRVRITNTNTSPARDATFFVYVDPASIVVENCTLGPDPADPTRQICTSRAVVPPNTTLWTRFVSFWSMEILKEKVLNAAGAEANENDHGASGQPRGTQPLTQFTRACQGGLREFPRTSPCNLGLIRAAGSSDVLGQDTDVRYYLFRMTETDDGTDQSAFRGWQITFTYVFQARLPAIPEPSGLVGER